MHAIDKRTSPRHIAVTLLYTLGFNTLIAAFITLVGFSEGFFINLIMSQCIGCSICTCVLITQRYFNFQHPLTQLGAMATALILGGVIGTFIGALVSGIPPAYFLREYGLLVRILILSVLFGAGISFFFVTRSRLSDSREKLQAERIRSLSLEKESAETRLRLLQAQVEPHFLFNTLSNVLSLIDSDREKAKSMLTHLSRYLRTSLTRSRMATTTLGQELEMVQSYVRIFKIRMGERLQYDIDIPTSLEGVSFAPMLIQPLVENAILHGLEPKATAGKVTIRAMQNRGRLRVTVADNGQGLGQAGPQGTGLANVRERLISLYGDKGRLIIKENPPSGVQAVIEVPYADH